MNDQLLQEKRVALLSTPLGANKLVLARFEGSEGLHEMFEFRVDALSEEADIDFNKILGLSCCVNFTTYNSPKRYFDGVLVEAQALGAFDELFAYRLVLRPQLWLLSRRSDCYIWHDKTAIEIIKDVFSDYGLECKLASPRDCRKREYCVQYRETDLAFVCRLMEDEGIYYFHEHSEGKHLLVLAFERASHAPIVGHEEVRFSTHSVAAYVHEEVLFEWSSERRFRSGKFELRDYNFKTPSDKLLAQAQAPAAYKKSDLEVYDYPGDYDTAAEGKPYVDIRRDAEQAADCRRYAAGEAPSLYPGGLVTVVGHPGKSENQKYLVVRAAHHFTAQSYRSVRAASEVDDKYHGSYEFLPSETVFHAPIATPKPIVYGPQTAKVVARPDKSQESEEIDVDEHGRIHVLFHWDRFDARSCWVRVAQMWAGAGWGGQFIPRIGMEVVVEFLEGDPDRPLVVGCVYNNNNKYPWTLPANKTQSGIKSDSSKGHGGYNQMRFEDKKDSEQIEMHAQKYHDAIVLDRETWQVGASFSGCDAHGAGVKESRFATLVHGDDRLDVQDGNQIIHIKNDRKIEIDDNHDVKIHKDEKVKIDQNQTIDVGQKILIKAGMEIKLQVGSNTITIDNSGIAIKGIKIDITADAITTVTGAMVKINC